MALFARIDAHRKLLSRFIDVYGRWSGFGQVPSRFFMHSADSRFCMDTNLESQGRMFHKSRTRYTMLLGYLPPIGQLVYPAIWDMSDASDLLSTC
jgi:hypothetical protein